MKPKGEIIFEDLHCNPTTEFRIDPVLCNSELGKKIIDSIENRRVIEYEGVGYFAILMVVNGCYDYITSARLRKVVDVLHPAIQ